MTAAQPPVEPQRGAGRKVYALTESRWEGVVIHAVYDDARHARHVLKLLKAEARSVRMHPDTAHPMEQNLYIEEYPLLSAHSSVPTLASLDLV